MLIVQHPKICSSLAKYVVKAAIFSTVLGLFGAKRKTHMRSWESSEGKINSSIYESINQSCPFG